MVYLANRDFLIGLVSLLSLVAADEFSDGTANYVQVPPYDQNECNSSKLLDQIRFNHYFLLKIYEKRRNSRNDPCLYRVLRFSIKQDTQEEDNHVFDVKASCAVSLVALSNIVRIGVPDQESIEFRQKGNRCVSYRWSYDNGEYHTDKTPDYDCGAPSYPVSEGLEQYVAEGLNLDLKPDGPDSKLKLYVAEGLNLELKPDGQVCWNFDYCFRVYNVLDNKKTCLYNVLTVLHSNRDYPKTTYFIFKTFKMSCDLDVYSIDRVVKVFHFWDDDLAFKLKNGKCSLTSPRYNEFGGFEERYTIFDCDEFLNPI